MPWRELCQKCIKQLHTKFTKKYFNPISSQFVLRRKCSLSRSCYLFNLFKARATKRESNVGRNRHNTIFQTRCLPFNLSAVGKYNEVYKQYKYQIDLPKGLISKVSFDDEK